MAIAVGELGGCVSAGANSRSEQDHQHCHGPVHTYSCLFIALPYLREADFALGQAEAVELAVDAQALAGARAVGKASDRVLACHGTGYLLRDSFAPFQLLLLLRRGTHHSAGVFPHSRRQLLRPLLTLLPKQFHRGSRKGFVEERLRFLVLRHQRQHLFKMALMSKPKHTAPPFMLLFSNTAATPSQRLVQPGLAWPSNETTA
mmetsp:Transcript_20037/g.76755  ORF Transcript_20037/g.76755 Transcript_20037/m.76755 type:complete len:203 (-) Transcript_20037:15-623(-)